jgi:hypothetical protein
MMNNHYYQENQLKIIRRKESKLRKHNIPIPTNAMKSMLNPTAYIQCLNSLLKKTIIEPTPRLFVAVDLEDNDCSICLEKLADNEDISHYKCGHLIHSSCLLKWNKNCPVCRCDDIDLYK